MAMTTLYIDKGEGANLGLGLFNPSANKIRERTSLEADRGQEGG